jgi:rare lipoprotein A
MLSKVRDYWLVEGAYWGLFGLPVKILAVALFLSGCTEIQVGSHLFKKAYANGTCKAEGDLKVGNPYRVDGITYTPMVSSLGYSEKGIASWYGEDFHGKASANGECYNMYAYTAAHKSLPLPSLVRVTNLENNRSIVVKVNDRGPFVRGRIIDLSYAAAQSLDVVRSGTAPVLVEAIGGPHHYVGGAKGGPAGTQLAGIKLGPEKKAESLMPALLPDEAIAEDLPQKAPLTSAMVESAQEAATPDSPSVPVPTVEVAKMDAVLPTPAEALPPPPPHSTLPDTSTQPLIKTNVYVQVGAFASVENAERLLDRLRAYEPSASLSKVESATGMTLTRVRSGPYGNIAEAEAKMQALVSAGFDGARLVVEGR